MLKYFQESVFEMLILGFDLSALSMTHQTRADKSRATSSKAEKSRYYIHDPVNNSLNKLITLNKKFISKDSRPCPTGNIDLFYLLYCFFL